MTEVFRIKLAYTGSMHKDIILELPLTNERRVVDSYYFLGGERADIETVKKVLRNHFEEWKKGLRNLNAGEKLYLLIDPSDEYYGGIEVIADDEEKLLITYVTIRDISALNFHPAIYSISEHEILKGASARVTLNQFLLSIENTLRELNL